MDAEVLTILAAVAAGIYLLLNLYALLGSNRLIFVPQERSYDRLPSQVEIPTGGGQKIAAVFLEHPDAKQTILFSHGNAEDMGNMLDFLRRFHELGFSLLLYDYRGYGASEGRPSVHRAKQDIEAAYRWLVGEKGIDPRSIIVQGRSLGGGPSTWLAARHEVGGLILESTFVSTFRVKTIWPLLPWDKLNNLRQVRRVRCPVLVIHGREDATIPFWHGEKLHAAAPGEKMCLWIEGACHTDYAYVAGEAYFDTCLELARRAAVHPAIRSSTDSAQSTRPRPEK